MPPLVLIRIAIALVWFYEGLWCKILGRLPDQELIVKQLPFLRPDAVRGFLVSLGFVECFLGVWTLSGWRPWWAALVQTALLATMNTCGIFWSRRNIHDPAGMLVKNFVFVILMWVAVGPSVMK